MEQKKKIIIADDDVEIIEILKTFITTNFPALSIFTALDGAKTMQSLEKIEFGVLFLDLIFLRLTD